MESEDEKEGKTDVGRFHLYYELLVAVKFHFSSMPECSGTCWSKRKLVNLYKLHDVTVVYSHKLESLRNCRITLSMFV